MNRFLLIPKLKPEFKMAQPLPAFHEIPTAWRQPANVIETSGPRVKPKHFQTLLRPATSALVDATRNLTA